MATKDNTNYEELMELEKDLRESAEYMATEVRREDAVIFVGNSRCGKSSLINYLIGNKLVGEKIHPCMPVGVIKADDSSGPVIGLGPLSETRMPKRWESKKLLGWAMWDTPGFADNRGSVQDIVNAFYISELFKNLKSVKIVLVTDINDIACGQIKSFLSVLKALENLFKGQMESSYSSVAVIFTKVPDRLHDNTVDKQLINELLSQYLVNRTVEISEPIRNFVRYLIQNNQNIGFFKSATVGDITESSIDVGIPEAIMNTNCLEGQILKDVSPSIADSSKVFLFQARDRLSSMQVFNELQRVVGDAFDAVCAEFENLKDSPSAESDLHELLRHLISTKDDIKKVLNPEMSFHEKIAILQTLDPEITKLVEENHLLQKAKFMVFIDRLLGLEETTHLDFNLQTIITTVIAKCDQLIISVKLRLGEISKDQAETEQSTVAVNYRQEIEQLKNELKRVKECNESAIQRSGSFLQNISSVMLDVIQVIKQWKSLTIEIKTLR